MISLIILAGGKGERFGGNKCLVSLNGKPVIDYAITPFEGLVDEIIVVSKEPYKQYKHAKPGATRQQSVYNGLKKCANPDFVIVHEAVRPFVTRQIVVDVILELINGAKSVSTAVPVVDGLMVVDLPLSKRGYSLTQTPEGFDYQTLLQAHKQGVGVTYEGDCQLVSNELGIRPVVVTGVFVNSKITFPQDLLNAEGILKFRQQPITTTPNLRGKTIAVYGATGSIGSACVELLKKQDAKVLTPRVNEIVECDGLIYAAGNYTDKIMEINFEIPYSIIERATCRNIVFLSSASATYGRKEALYSASKAALNSLIESKHEAWANKGIYLNAIAPQRVKGKLQKYFCPNANQDNFFEPSYVAEWCLKYLDTDAHGHIIYLKNKV